MKLTITTDDGTLVEVIDLEDYDLTNPVARDALLNEIQDAVKRGKQMETTT